jgi:hypothetical protein
MRFRPPLVTVLMTKGHLDFLNRFDPLGARLAFPKHHEALSADTAMGLSVSNCAFAEHLHIFCLQLADFLVYESDLSPFL